MTKFKSIGRLALIVCMIVCLAICPLFMGGAAIVHADEETGQETPVTDDLTDEDEGDGLQTLVESFLGELKARYGDEYETYYNAILTKWGSVEEYLLSLADKGAIPDAAADGWTAFVNWLGENAPIWAPVLAIIMLVIVAIIFRKKIKLLMIFAKLLFVRPTNKMFRALIAQNQALILLLGNGERSADARKALADSIEELQAKEEDNEQV